MSAASRIGKSLVEPGKLAKVLNWKRSCSVMALEITGDKVGVAIAVQPYDNCVVLPVDSIALAENGQPNEVGQSAASRLEDLARRHNVGAVVVGWPLQPEGRPGKPCGKVIHTLERWVEKEEGSVLSKKRPFTLWDNRSVRSHEDGGQYSETLEKEQHMDEWGRCIAFSRTPSPYGVVTLSSRNVDQKQGPDSSERASGVLKSFLKEYWQQKQVFETPKHQNMKNALFDDDSFVESSAIL
uniref:Uncharacterized protein n=1 Tax=Trieres chinensis TaxID=1514140 RepID=A0A7S2EEA7_TRICV|mmetsp:Transcript_20054/g.40641  ORF Transcript_20054/g.40641 Transcript_20054/m.40641 type:complete len:240 (+) Transcript_20054:208-927(+)|eukprot:CAMPEP_0183305488 /NCGR_PEP_ID=MMETSP0160_2-20130417/10205_1 /TAXON_ID=2839 ORGANISM="Odontella Sinensis, Strain Grunow 1884" /NCGR_SAMPLE_ID=MMETSP0160_2 /ASSEMBLY_ACC=CAM_ASM_000250 /LENGTH=239 /DNA_ID=CAMNT_0025468687 /DNA_START=176 /DNA_END=895 /DNA_ORIENTATION=+